jgi:Rab proteins geranylgeranyltransferase component A
MVLNADATLPALQRIRKYLRSTGRYGPSPFLFGHYGGVGEIAQGFCRTAAVAGATYILGRSILSVQTNDQPSANRRKYSLRMEDVEDDIRCDVLIASHDYSAIVAHQGVAVSSASSAPAATSYAVARCIAVIDQPLLFSGFNGPSEAAEDSIETGFVEDTVSSSSQKLEVDTAVLVFPPGSVTNGSSTVAVHALLTGEGSMSSPRGKSKCYQQVRYLC